MAAPLAVLEDPGNQAVYFARDFVVEGLRNFFFRASSGGVFRGTARASQISSLVSTRRWLSDWNSRKAAISRRTFSKAGPACNWRVRVVPSTLLVNE